jgi:hypothetical protein
VICLADNDIIHKLAACDLLDEVLTALNLARTDVYVLPTAKYKFRITSRSAAQGEHRYGAAVFARIRDFLASVREINVPGLFEEIQLLAGVDGIDSGEAVLFAATAQFDQYLLATCDKNSLRALVSTPDCHSIAQRLCGHVMCFEQMVKRVIQHCGFSYVQDKVIPARACDTALRVAFGSGIEATEAAVLTILDSYINELRSLSIDVLA